MRHLFPLFAALLALVLMVPSIADARHRHARHHNNGHRVVRHNSVPRHTVVHHRSAARHTVYHTPRHTVVHHRSAVRYHVAPAFRWDWHVWGGHRYRRPAGAIFIAPPRFPTLPVRWLLASTVAVAPPGYRLVLIVGVWKHDGTPVTASQAEYMDAATAAQVNWYNDPYQVYAPI